MDATCGKVCDEVISTAPIKANKIPHTLFSINHEINNIQQSLLNNGFTNKCDPTATTELQK
jgi:hypothetical protein